MATQDGEDLCGGGKWLYNLGTLGTGAKDRGTYAPTRGPHGG